MKQGTLFDALREDKPLPVADCLPADHPDYPPHALGAVCTLDGHPAKIIGRSEPYATIEPVDLDVEPIRCGWDVVADVLENGDGAFVREDDDTDDLDIDPRD